MRKPWRSSLKLRHLYVQGNKSYQLKPQFEKALQLLKNICVVLEIEFENLSRKEKPLFNVVTTWQCPRNVFQHWKRGEGVWLSTKKVFVFFQLPTDADRERLVCTNVSTLLFMIVWNCLSMKINRNCTIYVLKILKYHKNCNRNRLVVV